MEHANYESGRRNEALDGLRGVASLIVLLYHVQYTTNINFGAKLGFVMVDIFFVLSGFVLSSRYGAHRESFGDFATNRFGRLYPLHLLTLLTLALAEIVVFGIVGRHAVLPVDLWYTFILNVFLLQTVGLISTASWNTSSWSISVEFWLNIVWYFGLKKGFVKSWLYIVAWIVCALVLFKNSDSIDVHTENIHGISSGLMRGILGIAAGSLVYRVRAYTERVYSLGFELLMFCGLIVPWVGVEIGTMATGGASFFLAIVISPLLVAVTACRRSLLSKAMSVSLFIWLGAISYSVYLWHLVVIKIINFVGVLSPSGKALAMVVCTIALSSFSYMYFELPAQSFVKRMYRRLHGQPA